VAGVWVEGFQKLNEKLSCGAGSVYMQKVEGFQKLNEKWNGCKCRAFKGRVMLEGR